MAVELIVVAMGIKLPAVDKLTLLGLANFANLDREGEAWPSLDSLSDVTGLSRRSLNRSIPRLVAAGYVRREFRGNRVPHYFLDALVASYREWLSEKAARGVGLPARAVGAPVSGCHRDTLGGVTQTRQGVTQTPRGVTQTRQGVTLTPNPVSEPLKESLNNPSEAKSAREAPLSPRNPEPGTRNPEGFGEGGACAPGARNPEGLFEGSAAALPPGIRNPGTGGGGSSVKPSTLHISQEPGSRPFRSFRDANPDLPRSEYTDEVRAMNRALLQAAIKGVL